MMTSLDMHGFSVSILPVDAKELEALSEPVPMAAWPGLFSFSEVSARPLPDSLAPIAPIPSKNESTKVTLEHIAVI